MIKSLFLAVSLLVAVACVGQKREDMKLKDLTAAERHVIIEKGTEAPFTGEYNDHKEAGTYHCKQCGAALYSSEDKFSSGCGWPSFDDEIKGAVKRVPDADGERTEIVCAACDGHLGHVFEGEGFTAKDTRHCVNSISMEFVPKSEEAIFAGGCFWGVEDLMQRQDGVHSVESGYIGGSVDNPTYEQVCTGQTGHAEAVRIVYDPSRVDYETLAKLFFEIHDPTQEGGQGPDIGDQYRSVVFYNSKEQREVAKDLIEQLRDKGFDVKTELEKATEFFPAEQYHQDYYEKTGKEPYCHIYTKRF